MSTRQEEIIRKFDEAHHSLVEMLTGATPEQWRMAGVNHPEINFGEDEHRPVGVIAHHLATSYAATVTRCESWLQGDLPKPPDAAVNARHEADNPDPDRAATMRLLEDNASTFRAFVRRLTDEDLATKGLFVFGDTTVGQMVGDTVPFHIRWHEGSIRKTWEQNG